jgi:hypothetical protein
LGHNVDTVMMIKKQIVFLILLFCGSYVSFAQQQLTEREITLYGPQNRLGLNTYDIQNHRALPLKEAAYNPKNIHFGYLFGNLSKASLLVPDSKSYTGFTKEISMQIAAFGRFRNDGYFINLGNSPEALKSYDQIENVSELIALYYDKLATISKISGYKRDVNGPSDNISNLNTGDVIIFKANELDSYFLFKVLSLKQGHAGEIKLGIKGNWDKPSKKTK